jgi:putative SOS response-associated peptidase YedK
MCNLYSNTMPHDAMRDLFSVPPGNTHLGNMPALRAIYPKYEAPVIRLSEDGERELVRCHWGFLTPNKSKKTGEWLKSQAWNNTRDDKITSAPLWRDSFAKRRCLVPATAYAEATGRSPATFHWFKVNDADAFAFAGIWKHQVGKVGDVEIDASFYSVVTTSPNELAAEYHNRMPVVLAAADHDEWLHAEPDDAFKLLRPFPSDRMHVAGSGEGMREEPN